MLGVRLGSVSTRHHPGTDGVGSVADLHRRGYVLKGLPHEGTPASLLSVCRLLGRVS
jgi:hypothetical protein